MIGQSGQKDAVSLEGAMNLVNRWQLQEAKARFSALLRDAAREGPQTVTVRGRRAAVVLSADDYDRLRQPKPSLVALLRSSPLAGVALDVERDRSPVRSVAL